MAVMLDTATLPRVHRVEAFRAGLLEASGSTRIELESSPRGFWGQMATWSFGSSRLFTARSSGQTMVRDHRTARGASPEAVAIAVHGIGSGRHLTGTGQRVVRSGDLMVVDITRPFDFSWSGPGSSTSLQIPIAELGLPLDTVQRAAERLPSSPLYGMVSRHLVDLTRNADRLGASPTAAALGEASIHLVRALLSGALADDGCQADGVEETLLSQVHAHVRQHLHDPDLSPDSVARTLAVSRRQLFRVCQGADFSLEQYVIGKRLEGAKAELGSLAGRSRTIGRVAAAWGFKDATHFSRRFKAGYGLLPRDWRRLAAEESG